MALHTLVPGTLMPTSEARAPLSHFTDERTEAQRSYVCCAASSGRSSMTLDFGDLDSPPAPTLSCWVLQWEPEAPAVGPPHTVRFPQAPGWDGEEGDPGGSWAPAPDMQVDWWALGAVGAWPATQRREQGSVGSPLPGRVPEQQETRRMHAGAAGAWRGAGLVFCMAVGVGREVGYRGPAKGSTGLTGSHVQGSWRKTGVPKLTRFHFCQSRSQTMNLRY